tara:strand:- start:662 stop:1234 length:573 start_codon:yes stop_codon:yes gene_type:complete
MELSLNQRLSLVIETSLTAERLSNMPDAEINHALLVQEQVSPTLLRAAKITPLQLKHRGTTTPAHLAELGFVTLHLLDPAWCREAIEAYGATPLLDTFLATPNDAVILASSPAVDLLGINLGVLLLVCAEHPAAAREVLAQSPSLKRVPAQTLVETGLLAKDFLALGFKKEQLVKETAATPRDMQKLGFV